MVTLKEILTKFPTAIVNYDKDNNGYVKIEYTDKDSDMIRANITTIEANISEFYKSIDGKTYFVIKLQPEMSSNIDKIAELEEYISATKENKRKIKIELETASTVEEQLKILLKILDV